MNKKELKILRLKDVMAKTGFPKPSVYHAIRTNGFPKAKRLGSRSVGWLEHEVDQWIEDRPRANVMCDF